jgi:hypothetical protein
LKLNKTDVALAALLFAAGVALAEGAIRGKAHHEVVTALDFIRLVV